MSKVAFANSDGPRYDGRMNRHSIAKSGFTLVEVLVAAGIMAVVILGAAAFFAQQIKTATYLKSLNGLFSLQHDLQVTIANANLCGPALAGLVASAPLPKPAPVTSGTIWASDVSGQPIQATIPGTTVVIGAGDVPMYDVKATQLFLSNATQLPDDAAGRRVFTTMMTISVNTSGGSSAPLAPRPVGLLNLVLDPATSNIVSCSSAAILLHQDPAQCAWIPWGSKNQGGGPPDGATATCPVGQYMAAFVGTGVTTGAKRDFGQIYCCPP